MTASLLYYTCLRHDPAIEMACRRQIDAIRGDRQLVTVSLRPIAFGENVVVDGVQPGALAQCRQIVAGLARVTSPIVFFLENDVLYHPSHLQMPIDVLGAPDAYWYNLHVWRVRYADGHAIRTAVCRQVSGLSGRTALLLDHYRRRLARIEANGGIFDKAWSYEPGSFLPPRGFDAVPVADWRSEFPNLDIRHDRTMTRSKWSPADFRNKKWAEGWEETDGAIPGWGLGRDIVAHMKESTLICR